MKWSEPLRRYSIEEVTAALDALARTRSPPERRPPQEFRSILSS
jgi:hypothetical protein